VVAALIEAKAAVEQIERGIYGTDHRQIGASLLARWSFPDLYVDTAREHQSLNITSSHKTTIFIVSTADLMGELIRVGTFNEERNQLLAELFRRTELTDHDIQYYRRSFIVDMRKDPMFLECRSMFGLRD
jgi:HD-like signal output (HDOD) protein